jgi:hypothetical protein
MSSEKSLIVLTDPSELLLSAFSGGEGSVLELSIALPFESPGGGDVGATSSVGRDVIVVSGCLTSSNSLETVKLTEGHEVDSR